MGEFQVEGQYVLRYRIISKLIQIRELFSILSTKQFRFYPWDNRKVKENTKEFHKGHSNRNLSTLK